MKNELAITIGNNIKRLREQRKWSQGELAKKIGGTFQQISKYERGENAPGSMKLNQIAEILEVSVAELTQKFSSDASPHVNDSTPKHNSTPRNDRIPTLTEKQLEMARLISALPDEEQDKAIADLKKKIIEYLSGDIKKG
jgi:transcriptional regulator with XRE-family HTH domain